MEGRETNRSGQSRSSYLARTENPLSFVVAITMIGEWKVFRNPICQGEGKISEIGVLQPSQPNTR
jgi:hypothetical protein